MKTKIFKTNKKYFDFLNKNEGKIKVLTTDIQNTKIYVCFKYLF